MLSRAGRPKGAEEILFRLHYSKIAEWACCSVSTARQYASRGLYDPRDIDSVLHWANARRAKRGIEPVGVE